jgi:hypothetical protein
LTSKLEADVRELFSIPKDQEIQLIDFCNENYVQNMESNCLLKKYNLQENQTVKVIIK